MANPNYTYGVDTNDHAAMKRAYWKYKRRHIFITFGALAVIAFLGFFVYDFYAVNSLDRKPMFALKSRVENGTLYKGIGYNALFCDNGEKYVSSLSNKTCGSVSTSSYQDIIYNKTLEYMKSSKLLDKSNFLSFTINDYKADSNDENGTTYLVNVNLVCSDGSSRCLKVNVEYVDASNIPLFVTMDRYNSVVKIETLNKKGGYYNDLVRELSSGLRDYLIEHSLADEAMLKRVLVDVNKNYGLYKYQGETYANTYIVTVSYLCLDDTNMCINSSSFGDFLNLNFDVTLFVDKDFKVMNVASANVIS